MLCTFDENDSFPYLSFKYFIVECQNNVSNNRYDFLITRGSAWQDFFTLKFSQVLTFLKMADGYFEVKKKKTKNCRSVFLVLISVYVAGVPEALSLDVLSCVQTRSLPVDSMLTELSEEQIMLTYVNFRVGPTSEKSRLSSGQ